MTRRDLRGQGHERAVLEAVIAAAWRADACKIMLMTGTARGAKGFYESVEFTDRDKHAMIMRRP